MTPGALHSKLRRFLTSTLLTRTFYKLLHKNTVCSTIHRNADSVQIVINLDRCIAFCRITNICLPSFFPPPHPPSNPFFVPPTLRSTHLPSFLPSFESSAGKSSAGHVFPLLDSKYYLRSYSSIFRRPHLFVLQKSEAFPFGYFRRLNTVHY